MAAAAKIFTKFLFGGFLFRSCCIHATHKKSRLTNNVVVVVFMENDRSHFIPKISLDAIYWQCQCLSVSYDVNKNNANSQRSQIATLTFPIQLHLLESCSFDVNSTNSNGADVYSNLSNVYCIDFRCHEHELRMVHLTKLS